TIFSEIPIISLVGKEGRNEGLLSILFYALIFIFMQKIIKKDNIIKYINYLLIFGIIQTTFAILQSYFNIFPYFHNMAYAFCGNPNMFGLLISTLSILSISLYLFYKPSKFYLFTGIYSYIGLLLSESSGPFFTYCLILFIMFIYSIVKKINVLNLLKVLAILIILFPIIQFSNFDINRKRGNLLFYNSPQIYSDIISISKDVISKFDKREVVTLNNVSNFPSVSNGRFYIWKKSFQLGLDNIYNGIGPDMLEVYQYTGNGNFQIFDKSHNHYLEIFVSSGIFSLISYILFLVVIIKNGIKSQNIIVKCLLFAVLTYSIAISMNISTPLVAVYYYTLLGFIISLDDKESI
ncbi:MAG: O-antigen ligase family protein, partial [Bacilli bacterium]|nr:O-antigen ligase family protein [Bacilli bacterium]